MPDSSQNEKIIFHLKPYFKMAARQSGKTALYNMRGDRICDAYGCRKHVRLHQIDDFLLCAEHKRQFERDDPQLKLKTQVVPEDELVLQQIASMSLSSSNSNSSSQELSPIPTYSTNRIYLYTPFGAKLCDAYGCRMMDKLQNIYGGVFCPKHVKEYAKIRARINPHTGSFDEYQARIEELRFRKQWDYGHPQYAAELGKRYQ